MSTNEVPLLRPGLAERLFLTLNLGNLTIYGPAIKAIADGTAVVIPAAELTALRQRLADAEQDAARLDWLTRHIGGGELRRVGVVWPAWSPSYSRAAIDAAMEKKS